MITLAMTDAQADDLVYVLTSTVNRMREVEEDLGVHPSQMRRRLEDLRAEVEGEIAAENSSTASAGGLLQQLHRGGSNPR